LDINKIVIVASRWFSILLYLHWWCTVKHKSSRLILIIRHATRMHRIVLSYLAYLAVQYFSTCLTNGTNFRKT